MECCRYVIPHYVNKLSTALYHLQKQGDMCDVVLATKNGCINVHRVILIAAGSPFFHTQILNRRMQEKDEPTVINLYEQNLTDVETLVMCLYTGRVELSTNNVGNMKNLFHLLGLEDALKLCEQFMNDALESKDTQRSNACGSNRDIMMENVLLKGSSSCNQYSNLESDDSSHQMTQTDKVTQDTDLKSDSITLDSSKRKDRQRKIIIHRKIQGKTLKLTNKPKQAKNSGKFSKSKKSFQDTKKRVRENKQEERKFNEKDDDFCESDEDDEINDDNEISQDKDSVDGNCKSSQMISSSRLGMGDVRKLENTPCKTSSANIGKKIGKRVQKICAHCYENEQCCQCEVGPKGFRKKCPGCNLRFLDRSQMYFHMKEKHSYHCKLCEYHHCKESWVAQHMFIHHNMMLDEVRHPVIHCDQPGCQYKCIELNQYKRHQIEKHGDHKYDCKVCGKQFRSGPQYRMHCKSHIDDELKFVCSICGRKFHQQGLLNGHMKHVHSRQKLCHLCTWKGTHLRDLQVHLYTKHGQSLPDGFKTYNCDQCDYIAFYPKVLKNHKLLHTGEKTFQCQECGKLFATIYNLRGHAKMHGEKRFRCTFGGCDYKTVDRHKLKLHINSRHTDVKPYSCHLCPYSCKLRGNLDKHLRGTHRLTVTTIHDLWNKMTEDGQGYEAILERRRMIQNKEAIPLPTENNEHVLENGSNDNMDGYRDFTSSLCSQMPYTVLPTDGIVDQMQFTYETGGGGSINSANMQIREGYNWS